MARLTSKKNAIKSNLTCYPLAVSKAELEELVVATIILLSCLLALALMNQLR